MIARTKSLAMVAIVAAIVISHVGFKPAPKASVQETAEKLYASLTPEQRKQATLPLDSPERTKEVFTGGERAGIQIAKLSEAQAKQAFALLTAFTSEYGLQKAMAVSDQASNTADPTTGFARYYLCFFGEVGPGKSYAWRIAEHHLTIVDMEVADGAIKSVGPILLGANPPVLWDEEEDKMLALYSAMSPAEREKAQQGGKGISTEGLKGQGIRVGDLNPSAQEAAKAVLVNRLSFFSDRVRGQIDKILESQGGLNAMQVAFWGKPEKKCRDGGRWDFKLAGPSFLCDYEGSRAHVHLSMKGSLQEARTSAK